LQFTATAVSSWLKHPGVKTSHIEPGRLLVEWLH
jgi:hypothetical protein